MYQQLGGPILNHNWSRSITPIHWLLFFLIFAILYIALQSCVLRVESIDPISGGNTALPVILPPNSMPSNYAITLAILAMFSA